MKRREFITLLGGATGLAGRGASAANEMPAIGFVGTGKGFPLLRS